MRVSTTLSLLAATVASAQSAQSTNNYTSSLEMHIDANSVPDQRRAVWCQAQANTCDLLCNNDADKNSCSQTDLKFECTCASNNTSPGLQFYTQTMPTFICQELFSQCNMQNVGSADGQEACNAKIRAHCGTIPPPKVPISSDDNGDHDSNTPISSTMSGTTASPTGSAVSTTSRGLAPTMVPVANGAAAAAVALSFWAYLI